MESLSLSSSRRRKHSTATNGSSSSYSSFSFRSPYDDVLLSNGGKARFEAHEYAEIFSGSSSIPVLELSGLNERVGSRSSKLDYSNIFGGLRGDDVAVPYEQLFSGALKNTKTRIPVDVGSPSVNSSRMIGRPSGAPDQSNDGLMQQHFNMSFSKTGQRNNKESNGKTHIAQLHAVPGFTHFVEETSHLQKKDYERPMKREVSRTWSFSSGAEPISVKGVIASEKSHMPDKSCNVNGVNLKSHISKTSLHLCNPNDNMDLRCSNLPSFASKDGSNLPSFASKDGSNLPSFASKDGSKLPSFASKDRSNLPSFASKEDSKKSDGEYSPPFLDEELDENSVEAVSAAALKKAIDQAQESIRIAKMIMEKGKEGLKDGSKPRSKSRSKVKGKKETGINHVPDALKVNNGYGKCGPSLRLSLNGRKAKVETVRENVEAAIDHRDAFTEVGKKYAPSCIENEMLTEETIEVGNVEQNVEAGKAHGKRPKFTGLATNEKCRAVTSDSGKIDNIDYSICSTNKVEPCMEQMEISKGTSELSELTVHHSKGHEIVSEIEESAVTSDSGKIDNIDYSTCSTNKVESCMEQMETSKGTLEQSELAHQSKGPEIVSEIEDSASNSSQSVYKDLEQCEVNVDCIEGPESVAGRLGRLLHCSESEREQESDGNLTDSNGVIDDKEECQKEFVKNERLVCTEKLTQLKFEYDNPQNGLIGAEKDMLKQPDLDRKPENVSEWKENKQDGKHSDEIADTHRDSSEYGSAENMQMETDNISDIEKSDIPWDVDEVNDTHRGSRRSEENQDKFEFQVVASEKDVYEVIDAHCSEPGTIFTGSHIDNKGPIFSETQEPYDVDFNYRAEECKAADRGCTGNDSLPLETETLSEVEDNGVASEEKFIESQTNSTFDGLSSDEETLPKAEKMVETDREIHNAAEEYAGKINTIKLPEFHTNDDKVTEVGSTVKPSLERTSENHEESLKVPTQESQACRENLKDNISNTEGEKDVVVVNSDERKYSGEQVEGLHSKDQSGNLPSQLHSEEKEVGKSMKTEREVRIGQKDAKGNDQKSQTNERIEAIKRGREREKDKKAAERAIREARERAFAEARERAERAAVERAAAEARQRGMAEARDNHDKASVENKKPADKVSTGAKLRAERAAVERATTEARERALEKAMSQKTRTQTEKLSSSSLNNGLKHSFSSSDLEKIDGGNSESAQRCKARLESHQRIMERAAKALAEKNMRDILAQKEQAERNRLAESLDADIKRWATGKEGNLRALLSTLQYILGPDGGWQPVSLTDIITTAAVKKGYRKATLCVHPDKLQQRGATIQQKYICEKVFDLLKAAWNRFNSEER